MRNVIPVGQVAPTIAGGEVEVTLMITGTVDVVGVPEAPETMNHAGNPAENLVRPAAT
jgi:hypothetical protein